MTGISTKEFKKLIQSETEQSAVEYGWDLNKQSDVDSGANLPPILE